MPKLASTSLTTEEATGLVKEKMFLSGPADFSYRLKTVDNRLQELKKRALESSKVCLTSTPVLYKPNLPNNESFPLYLSCKDQISDKLTVYFGKMNSTWYLAMFQITDIISPTIAVLASIDSDGSKVDTWQIMVDESTTPFSASVLHIKADKSFNTISVITASSITQVQGNQLASTGIGCGVQLSSTSEALWIFGYPFDNSTSNLCPSSDTDYLSKTDSSDWQEFCVSPSGLTDVSSGSCTSLKNNYPLSIFSYNQLVSTLYGATAYNLAHSPAIPTGVVDF